MGWQRWGMRGLALVAALAAACLAAPVAEAGTVSIDTSSSLDRVTFSDTVSEENDLTVTFTSGPPHVYEVSDQLSEVTAGAGCVQQGTNSVRCESGRATPPTMRLSLGGQDDVLDFVAGTTRPGATIFGGDGDDVLSTSGLGGDLIDGGPGADDFDGGPLDTVTYETRSVPVTVNSGDNLPNDGDPSANGGAGENDNVRPGVMFIVGGSAGDTITGGGDVNFLIGGGGPDTLNGAGGADTLRGEEGDDMHGGPDSDTVRYASRSAGLTVDLDNVADDGEAGEADNARDDIENITGGQVSDTLTGDSDANTLEGGGLSDTLHGGEGADVLRGGSGADIENGHGDNDTFDQTAPSGGTDTLNGGADTDTADYNRGPGVTVDIDNEADDGNSSISEADVVKPDVENLKGGRGRDTLTGDGDANKIEGNGGDDTLNGAGGADDLQGGPDDDTLDGGPGGASDGDTLSGGSSTDSTPDSDVVTYAGRSGNVNADPTGTGDDGEAGEGDTVSPSVEGFEGGPGPDVLTGNDGPGTLNGNGGADELRGGGGDDAVDGGEGDDSIEGGAGEDQLRGSAGGDTIFARDEVRDAVSCGSESDTLTADRLDEVGTDCEQVDLPPAPAATAATASATLPETGPGLATDTTAPIIGLSVVRRQTPATVARKGLKLTISCDEPCTIAAGLRLDARTARRLKLRGVIGRASRALAAPGRTTLTVKLSRKAARKVKRLRSIKLDVQVSATDQAGNGAAARRAVTVKKARR